LWSYAAPRGRAAAGPRGKRAIAGGFIIASSPSLRVVVSEPLSSGPGWDVASGWFVQVADLDTRPHVAPDEVVCAVTQWLVYLISPFARNVREMACNVGANCVVVSENGDVAA